eukprot:c7602_g1_i4.p1 GENE.c7602_g1_i4~~c7602_g1_i4.p1  ORF type:complete len:557 (+),score=155.38 c7602_g1_i4:921-2591(+)
MKKLKLRRGTIESFWEKRSASQPTVGVPKIDVIDVIDIEVCTKSEEKPQQQAPVRCEGKIELIEIEDDEETPFVCFICGNTFTQISEMEKQSHVNECLDKKPRHTSTLSSAANAPPSPPSPSPPSPSPPHTSTPHSPLTPQQIYVPETPLKLEQLSQSLISQNIIPASPQPSIISSPTYACFICGKSLSGMDYTSRASHVKGCSKEFEVAPIDTKPQKPHFPGPRRTLDEFFYSGPKVEPRTPTKCVPSPSDSQPRSDTTPPKRKQHPTPLAFNKKQKSPPKQQQPRELPWYKKIPGTTFTVDGFRSTSVNDGVTHYFLSHFHADHYAGLRSSFNSGPIYCSQITANLVKQQLRVNPSYLHPLPMNIPTTVANVSVTLMDANHCPGAVIILFRLPDGTTHLHTGDFRAIPEMQQYTPLKGVTVDTLFLDTTYCDPRYAFPPQNEMIDLIVNRVREELKIGRTLVLIGSYQLLSLLKTEGVNYSRIVAIRPTGWTHSASDTKQYGPVKVIGVPYSEHSSFSELKQFVHFINARRVVPTVNNSNGESVAKMLMDLGVK